MFKSPRAGGWSEASNLFRGVAQRGQVIKQQPDDANVFRATAAFIFAHVQSVCCTSNSWVFFLPKKTKI